MSLINPLASIHWQVARKLRISENNILSSGLTLPISCHWSLSIHSENLKTLLMFSGAYIERDQWYKMVLVRVGNFVCLTNALIISRLEKSYFAPGCSMKS